MNWNYDSIIETTIHRMGGTDCASFRNGFFFERRRFDVEIFIRTQVCSMVEYTFRASHCNIIFPVLGSSPYLAFIASRVFGSPVLLFPWTYLGHGCAQSSLTRTLPVVSPVPWNGNTQLYRVVLRYSKQRRHISVVSFQRTLAHVPGTPDNWERSTNGP